MGENMVPSAVLGGLPSGHVLGLLTCFLARVFAPVSLTNTVT